MNQPDPLLELQPTICHLYVGLPVVQPDYHLCTTPSKEDSTDRCGDRNSPTSWGFVNKFNQLLRGLSSQPSLLAHRFIVNMDILPCSILGAHIQFNSKSMLILLNIFRCSKLILLLPHHATFPRGHLPHGRFYFAIQFPWELGVTACKHDQLLVASAKYYPSFGIFTSGK